MKSEPTDLSALKPDFEPDGCHKEMSLITFRYELPLEETMVFEAVYHECLQLDLSDKEDILNKQDLISVWMFLNGELAGESYGNPLPSLDEHIEGLEFMSESEKETGIYCYSNTVLPPFQNRGLGTILKAHWLGMAAAKGFRTVYGHARAGGSQALNAKFGATFLDHFSNWYGTGEEYLLYRLVLDRSR